MLAVPTGIAPVAVVKDAYQDVRKHLGTYFKAGLGLFVAILLVVIGSCIVSALPLLPLLMTENELVLMGSIGVAALVFIVCNLVISFVYAPCYLASLLHGVALHRGHGTPLTFKTVWKHPPPNKRDIVLVYLGVQLIVSIGIVFCILPGLVLALLTAYAFPLVALYRMKPMTAIKASIDQVQEDFSWHLIFWGLTAVSVMLFAWIPILGTFLAQSVIFRLHLGATENTFGQAPVSEY
jgi:hypothetical protein